MFVAELENLRIRVDAHLNRSFGDFSERKKISKQDAINSLLAWFLDQDGLLQSLIVGQIESDDHTQVAAIVLKRMVDDQQGKGKRRTPPMRGSVTEKDGTRRHVETQSKVS